MYQHLKKRHIVPRNPARKESTTTASCPFICLARSHRRGNRNSWEAYLSKSSLRAVWTLLLRSQRLPTSVAIRHPKSANTSHKIEWQSSFRDRIFHEMFEAGRSRGQSSHQRHAAHEAGQAQRSCRTDCDWDFGRPQIAIGCKSSRSFALRKMRWIVEGREPNIAGDPCVLRFEQRRPPDACRRLWQSG